jgi:hypothetical protein
VIIVFVCSIHHWSAFWQPSAPTTWQVPFTHCERSSQAVVADSGSQG